MTDYLFQVSIQYSDASIVVISVDVIEQEAMLLARDKAIALVEENQSKYARPGLTIMSVSATEASRVHSV